MRHRELAVNDGRSLSTALRAEHAARMLDLDTCQRCGRGDVTIVSGVAVCEEHAAELRLDRRIQQQRETVARMRATRA